MAEKRARQAATLRARMVARLRGRAADGDDGTAVEGELEDWADLDADLDRDACASAAEGHAKFCGEAFGICEASGHSADMATVSRPVWNPNRCKIPST